MKRISLFHKNIKSEKVEKFEGAYVKEPQVGMHKWVMSFDLNSLYPHLIMQYNISPETLVNADSEIKKEWLIRYWMVRLEMPLIIA